jgi:hypothetical protein
VGALGGVVLTQVFAARREDKRWQQERERELGQHEREDRFRDHADRQSAYASLLTAVSGWQFALIRLTDASDESRPELAQKLGERKEHFLHAYNTLRLLAPAPVKDACGSVFDAMLDVDDSISDGEDVDFDSLSDALRHALEAMRADLGVHDQALPMPDPTA